MKKARLCVKDRKDPNSDMFVPFAKYCDLVNRISQQPRFKHMPELFGLFF